jgi:hypothetical protein
MLDKDKGLCGIAQSLLVSSVIDAHEKTHRSSVVQSTALDDKYFS